MLYNRKFDRALILLVPLAFLVYLSARPHQGLRAEMPPEFVDVQPRADPAHREAEELLAHRYWDCALTFIQWKYSYASPLPEIPPDEFRVNMPSAPGSEPASSTRQRYWKRLRQVWLLPSAWNTTREWSIQWLMQPLRDGWTWIDNFIGNQFAHR